MATIGGDGGGSTGNLVAERKRLSTRATRDDKSSGRRVAAGSGRGLSPVCVCVTHKNNPPPSHTGRGSGGRLFSFALPLPRAFPGLVVRRHRFCRACAHRAPHTAHPAVRARCARQPAEKTPRGIETPHDAPIAVLRARAESENQEARRRTGHVGLRLPGVLVLPAALPSHLPPPPPLSARAARRGTPAELDVRLDASRTTAQLAVYKRWSPRRGGVRA